MKYWERYINVDAVTKIWYFLCPETNKQCRILYSIGGYFLHREAFNGCMYESQTKGKSYRNFDKTFGVYFKLDQLYEQIFSKHFKKVYAGKPTKRYLRIMEQIQRLESVDKPKGGKGVQIPGAFW
jgi:hypothetical protein